MAKNMISSNPGRALFRFAIPLVFGNMLQQFYNIVDSIIVGKYIGSNALAAVGASASIIFLFVAVATGLSIGASIVISQYFGAGQYGNMKTSISTILISSSIVSILLSIVGVLGNHAILRLMQTPDNVFKDASAYLSIYFAGLIFLFLYNTLTAVFNAMGNSMIPFFFLAISAFVNIGLDLLFIRSFHLGVTGVAYATLISQALSAVLSFVVLYFKIKKLKITESFSFFRIKMLGTICRMAIPSIVQQSIVSVGMVLVQSLVNQYGSIVMAGYAAATKIDSIALMPMVNVGSAMSTFTAQNIGASKMERIKPGLRAAKMISGSVALCVSLVLLFCGDVFISAFVSGENSEEVISIGVEYLRVVGVCYIIMGIMNSYSSVLRGAGDIKFFVISSICNLSSRVLLAYVFSFFMGAHAVWYAIPIGWLAGLAVSFFRYRSGKWKDKKVI